jgi:dTDP-4-dehydrorhamnose 3,5-epimerase
MTVAGEGEACVKLAETALAGVYRIVPDRHADARGFFGRVYCERALREWGLHSHYVQHSVSFNKERGTLRGLHFQRPPHAEIKLIQCLHGRIFDVVVDVRRESPDFGRWTGLELSAESGEILYVPERFAHGFVTLTDEATLHYCISVEYEPTAATGLRWDDPDVGIAWPLLPRIISERDLSLMNLKQLRSSICS